VSATQTTKRSEVSNPQRWGLANIAVEQLGEGLRTIWERFSSCFKTQTRDKSEYAWFYLRGLLTMDTKRNYANIARRVIDPTDDGQNLQQFMSDSPWSGEKVFEQIQAEIQERPELKDGMLTLDESGDERAGGNSAGAARQYIGRLGKVEMGQVGVALGYYAADIWTMVDAELYLPESWFEPDKAKLRRQLHIPEKRNFLTKQQLGVQLISQAQRNGLPFSVVSCDCLYGRDSQFRADVDALKVTYIADIPIDTQVYLSAPLVGIPEKIPGTRGRPPSRPKTLSSEEAIEVRNLATHEEVDWHSVNIRHTERGELCYRCAALRVWTLTPELKVREEWLFIRQEADGTFTFSLSNASPSTSIEQLALWRCLRYFAERTFQDAKSEAGWDELVARKYRAWIHHTALDALALWFVAQTKLDWRDAYPRDPALMEELEVVVLPALSMANVRELLKAVLPLKQLSPEEATRLVVKHLVNRSFSTRSRLKKSVGFQEC
jgi:SRSO17 transposase